TQDARAFIQFTSKTPTYRQYYGNYVYEGESGWSTVTIKIAQADLNNFNYLDIAVRGKLSTSGTVELAMKKLEKGNKATDWSPAPEDALERITKAEANIKINSEAIELKAEKSKLTNFVDKPQYNEKIGQLDDSINGITGTVSDIKADVDKNTGDIKSANSKISKVEQTANSLTTTVSNISADVNKAKQDITKVEQT